MERARGGLRRRDPHERLREAGHGMRSRDVGPDDGGGDMECGAARNRVCARDVVRVSAEVSALRDGQRRPIRGAADQTGARKTARAATNSSASSAAPTASARCTS